MKIPKISANLGGVKRIKLLNLNSFLSIVFLLLIVYLTYVAYTKLYLNIFGNKELPAPAEIVRVNLKSYEETVHLIRLLESYSPDIPQIENPNLFR